MERDSRQPALVSAYRQPGWSSSLQRSSLTSRKIDVYRLGPCKPSKPPLRTSNPTYPAPAVRPRHALKPRIRRHPSASSLAPHRDGFHQPKQLTPSPQQAPHPIPALKTTEINTTTTAAPASSLGSHPTKQTLNPARRAYVQLPSLPNSTTVPQHDCPAAACRIPLPSSLLTHPSILPSSILPTTLISQSQKHDMMPRPQTGRPAAAGFFHPSCFPSPDRRAGRRAGGMQSPELASAGTCSHRR